MGTESWTLGESHQNRGARYSILRFIRPGDDVRQWKELITVENLPPVPRGMPIEGLFSHILKGHEELCPGRSQATRLNQDALSILFEVRREACAKSRGAHAVTRVILARFNTFVLSYESIAEMDDGERAKWVDAVGNAHVQTYVE